ncbi:MAG: hypothetical protein MUC82_01975 [Cypionkella sp.]|nr:hypothetical protein [Cypionkella sp.]
MTVQMTRLPDLDTAQRIGADPFAPPVAPLAMPKQVLVAQRGALVRAVLALAQRLPLIKHSLRRTG